MTLLLLPLLTTVWAAQVDMSPVSSCPPPPLVPTPPYPRQVPRPMSVLPLDQQIGQGRIVGGEEATDGEFPFQVGQE